MKTKLLIPLAIALLAPESSFSQEDPAHEELRTLRKGILEAITKGDIDAQLKFVHPDVVITWQNQVVCYGKDELKAFFEETGAAAFKGYKVAPESDKLSALYGDDTAVSAGRSSATYKLLGKEHEFENRWTATMVKADGEWLVAAYHVSLNALDNPILTTAKTLLYGVGGGALVLGLLLGCLLGRRKKSS